MFAGKCGLALRGRRDDGELLCPDDFNDIDVSSGNFRALLQYTAHSGCSVTKAHLLNHRKNASSISKTAQNQLIACIGQHILQKICDEERSAELFSIMADETTDIARTEQFTLVIRYVHKSQIKEQFMGFSKVEDYKLINCPLGNEIDEINQMKAHGSTMKETFTMHSWII